ncbi:hypothetical protein AHF37_01399 [Paragonimus kellicotti]|nr:hypothetical protein AHF37_01399 [Paragonimus kellicotti]
MLSSCRDVATGLRNVLQAASRTPGCRSPTDPVHNEVRTNAQVSVSIVYGLWTSLGLSSQHYCSSVQFGYDSRATGESIVRTARALMDDTQSLVSGTGEDQTRLASTAHVAVERVTQLADVVKRGAVVIGPGQPDTQVISLSFGSNAVVTGCIIWLCFQALLRYSEASSETRNACAASSKALAEEFAILLDALKATLFPDSKAADRERIANAARRIADLSRTLLNLLDNLREGPRLVMYFRASSPEWRDVAEKYIGRHVAYHHHYVPNYAIAGPGSTHHSSYVRPTCYPLRMRRGVVGEPNDEDQIDEESESRIDAAIEQISATLNASKPSEDGASLLRTAHSVATATRNLIRTAKSIGLAPPLDAAERARRASGSKQRNSVSCSLWRAELTLALATQDMCHLAELCSQAQKRRFSNGLHGLPSKERLLAAVRRVAAASAQLLLSAKSKRLMCITEDIQKLQAAGQVVKETTDRLSSSLQQGHFSCDSSGLYVTAPLSPTLQVSLSELLRHFRLQAVLFMVHDDIVLFLFCSTVPSTLPN